MNVIKIAYARTFQFFLRIASKIVRFPIPMTKERLEDIPTLLNSNGLKCPILIVSNTVSKGKRYESFIKMLEANQIKYFPYIGIASDPTFKTIEVLAGFYKAHECDSIIAIGGGSVIDAAKAMGVLVSNKYKNLSRFKGVLKVKKKLPYFIAVPTTAGTGSEASIASVVTNEETKDKFAISDGKLVPNVAILDDSLLKGLPSELVATTGMDAFTHAIESYMNHAGNKKSKEYAKKSLYLIKNHLYEFYSDRENDIARHNMLYASFYAAISFTRSYVGYVHALAHAIGGVYHKPHGYLIAILLPYVLEAYGKNAYKALAKASIEMGIGSNTASREENALSLISWIRELNQKMGIPNSLDNLINEKDYLPLAEHASIEANPWYPVPKELDKNELAFVLRKANSKNN
ncbi:MAG: iron-containing alcohol dehydrogenase [Acholeplasmatales bacterium]|nr:iron-containing alcohol dehydrogenase [Acholeplasmatales bacterium]